ncbi:superinfection immunity protein [Acetobacter conturbans]|uniref:Superinfection immunity protein n=1 Tax=Acetobacter conturbans TaxID=1737472 RepID=A0ABX0JZW2_9PROT|nr:superinfection immunity protein [Acetobacter conturbans]NHN88949.1 superinfection immunity protein [Acetobacter conturbans]
MMFRKAALGATALLVLSGEALARGDNTVPPLANAELADHEHVSASAEGLKAAVDLQQKSDCGVPTLLGDEDGFASGACRMATLTLTDSSRPERLPFMASLTPYNRDGSDVRDLQLDVRRLDANAPLPQAVVSVYTGGAHCCALTSIIGTTKEGAWTATKPSELAGEGRPQFADIDGDKVPEIIAGDESFLYTFASHAGSYTPSLIYRYQGGHLVNVTTDPASRSYLAQELHENEGFWVQQNRNEPNGFLAYYVAMKANMDQFAEGWAYMLPRYDHEIDAGFSPSLCSLGSRADAECTPEEQAPLPFPQALAGFLVAKGYVTPQQALAVAPDAESAIREASRYHPDFSCLTPPQKNGVATMLCENSAAAQHELQFDQVYYALRAVVGPAGWKGLKQEIILAENAVDQQCGLPVPGAADQTVPPDATACYAAGMDRLSEAYRARLSGAALEESKRPIGDHIALQRRLIALGYLPAGSIADGVYGESTRAAITAWKHETQQPESSPFLSDADAVILMGHPLAPALPQQLATQEQKSATPVSGSSDSVITSSSSVISYQKTGWSLFGLSFALSILFLVSAFTLYFVPFIVACLRDTIRKPAVFAVNFFLGWTLIGWVAAMVMAVSLEARRSTTGE